MSVQPGPARGVTAATGIPVPFEDLASVAAWLRERGLPAAANQSNPVVTLARPIELASNHYTAGRLYLSRTVHFWTWHIDLAPRRTVVLADAETGFSRGDLWDIAVTEWRQDAPSFRAGRNAAAWLTCLPIVDVSVECRSGVIGRVL